MPIGSKHYQRIVAEIEEAKLRALEFGCDDWRDLIDSLQKIAIDHEDDITDTREDL